jgi:hypothetical protein
VVVTSPIRVWTLLCGRVDCLFIAMLEVSIKIRYKWVVLASHDVPRHVESHLIYMSWGGRYLHYAGHKLLENLDEMYLG